MVVDGQDDPLCICPCKDQLVFTKCWNNAWHILNSVTSCCSHGELIVELKPLDGKSGRVGSKHSSAVS